ncbi:MAG: YCF48-related protein, partial [Coriobacteriia bacterium]|nr:YCF48-related protein [Coriobacteriia bacterium]
TTDGGATWTPQTSGVASGVVLRSVFALSSTTAWFTGDGGNIRKTVNSGDTWTAQTSGTTTALYDIRFRDADNGYAVGGVANVPAIVRKTVDGGTNWTTQIPGTINILRAVQFTDADHGWIVGDSGTILRTTDNTAPHTTLVANPAAPNGANGWYQTPLTFQLVPDEPGITYYSFVSATGPWSTYSVPIAINTQGVTDVWYYSIDPGANKEAVRQATLRIDTSDPLAPVGLLASPTATDTVSLYWPAGADAISGVGHYEIEMDGSVVATTTLTSFNVTGLAKESRHDFVVRTVDTAGRVSADSPTASATTLADLPRPPAIVYARAVDSGAVYLGWAESTGTVSAVEYRLYRSLSSGPFSLAGTASVTAVRSYEDTTAPDLTNVRYAVSVVDSRGEGPTSTVLPSATTTTVALPAPVALAAVPTTGTITLTWRRPQTPVSIAGYRVFRSSASTATPSPLTASLVTTTTYSDATVQPHGEYWYSAVAISSTATTGRTSYPVFSRAVATSTVEPPHGTYSDSTDMCALCHSPHTATSVSGLLKSGSTNDVGLCLSCHDGTSAPDILTALTDPARTSRHPIAVGKAPGYLSCS